MATVYCNTCSKISPYKGIIKNAVCSCGSKDLSAVAGRWNDQKAGWDYYDRQGGFVGFMAVGSTQNIEAPKKPVEQIKLDL